MRSKNLKTSKLKEGGGISAALMLVPAVFLLATTSIYPFLWLFRYIFTDYNGFQSTFTGLDNVTRMLGDKIFWSSVLHTFEYAIMKLIIIIPLSLLLAVFLTKKIRGTAIFQAIFFMPTVTSTAIYSLIFGFIFAVFNGALNDVLSFIGLINSPVDWLGDPDVVMMSIIIVAVWGGVGNYTILFIAGMSSISPEVYESSKIDGANGFQTFFKITLPMLSPVLKVILLLAITGAFRDYESILVLTGGGPNNRSQVMFTYIYELIFGASSMIPQIGYATLLSAVAAIIIGIVTAIYLYFARKLDNVL